MRVVDLDDRIVIHSPKVAFARFHLAEDLLGRAAHQEILLIKAKDLSRLIGIIRIYKQCQILIDRALIKFDPVMNNRSVRALQIKKPEFVDAAVIAGDTDLIHARPDLVSAKVYIEFDIRQILPGVPLDPGILVHLLHIV